MISNTRVTKMLARNGWQPSHGLRLLFAVAAVIALTFPAWVEMAYAAARHDSTRPSVLVIPIMVWLIWVRRARFRFVRPDGSALGWVLLSAGALLFFLNHNNVVYDFRSMWHFGAVMMLAGAIFVCTGKSVIRQFAPAWLIMPLLVPIPVTLSSLLAVPVQLIEAHTIAALYGLFGVGVEVFSTPGLNRIVVGDRTLPLDSVCKGLPTMMSLVLICYGFVFGSPMRGKIRVTLLLIAPFIALGCSSLALACTLWLYDGGWALVTADLVNAISQWLTLMIAFLLIAAALRVLTWASVPVHQYHLASTAA